MNKYNGKVISIVDNASKKSRRVSDSLVIWESYYDGEDGSNRAEISVSFGY